MIKANSKIERVVSLNHLIEKEFSEHETMASVKLHSLENRRLVPEKDFVLLYRDSMFD